MLCTTSLNAQQRPGQKNPEPFSNLEEAKEFLKEQEANDLFSGTVLVSINNDIKLLESYGLSNKSKKAKNNIDTKINIGSLNKAFTAVCVLQLVEQGKLDLDDKIKTYIPELAMEMADEITIRHLLQMKSGLGFYHMSPAYQAKRNSLRKMEAYLPFIKNSPLSFKPGTDRQYSNSGYELLGILVQRISGYDYYDYVMENVYNKAQMKNTGAFERDKKTPNLARGYTKYAEGQGPGSPISASMKNRPATDGNSRHAVKGTAAGGGYSTVKDLYNFVNALWTNELIGKDYTDLMFSGYEDQAERRTNYRIGGGSIGINAHIMADFSKDYLVIVLANFDPPTATDVARKFAKTIDLGQL